MISNILHTLVANPGIYDTVQRLVGMNFSIKQMKPIFEQMSGCVVLDIGAGTGLYLSAFPANSQYIWLDNDSQKLEGFQKRSNGLPAILGDATQIGLADKAVDFATCIAIVHHLDDAQFHRFVDEAARVVRTKLILLDPLATEAWQSKLLWRYDRGSYPRTAEQLKNALSRRFDVEQVDYYAVYHRYAILHARPKTNKE